MYFGENRNLWKSFRVKIYMYWVFGIGIFKLGSFIFLELFSYLYYYYVNIGIFIWYDKYCVYIWYLEVIVFVFK